MAQLVRTDSTTSSYFAECSALLWEFMELRNQYFVLRGISGFGAIPVEAKYANINLGQIKKFASYAHRNQLDKGGKPYIAHPIHVGDLFNDPLRKALGYLHDTIEDTPVTWTEIYSLGLDSYFCACLRGISRRSGESYDDYIQRVCSDIVIMDVKVADLSHNMDIRRLQVADKWAVKRCKRYCAAMGTLVGVLVSRLNTGGTLSCK